MDIFEFIHESTSEKSRLDNEAIEASANGESSENAFDILDEAVAKIDEQIEIAKNEFDSNNESLSDSLSENNLKQIKIYASGFQKKEKTITSTNCTIERKDIGRYSVKFLKDHPENQDYEVVFGVDEASNTLNVAKVSVVENSRKKLGFDIQVTVDDNGDTADIYEDKSFSFLVLTKGFDS